MTTLKITTEARADSEEEARNFLDEFKSKAKGSYIVGANGYTYKKKTAKGEIVDEAWICKCTAIYGDVWNKE